MPYQQEGCTTTAAGASRPFKVQQRGDAARRPDRQMVLYKARIGVY